MTYPKLAKEENCAYPKRKHCDWNGKILRCKYMKYNNAISILDPKRWECTFKK